MDDVRVASRRGALRVGLRALAAGLLLMPAWFVMFGVRGVFGAAFLAFAAIAAAAEVALEPWAERRLGGRLAGVGLALLVAWAAPWLALAQDEYVRELLAGGGRAAAIAAAAVALQPGDAALGLVHHAAALALAAPVAAAAASRLSARARPADNVQRATVDYTAALLTTGAVCVGAWALCAVAGTIADPRTASVDPGGLVVLGALLAIVALFLTPVLVVLGELAGRLEDLLVRRRLVR